MTPILFSLSLSSFFGSYLPQKDSNQSYLPTPKLGQDMTQGQFLSGV